MESVAELQNLQPVRCWKTALEVKLDIFQGMILIFYPFSYSVWPFFIREQDKEVKICILVFTLGLITVVAE